MTADIIQFPEEVREDIVMGRLVQRACSRLGWKVELREAISIYCVTKAATVDPAMEAIARNVADELGISMHPVVSQ